MKLVINRFVYESPGIAIIPETDFEAAVLSRYWETAVLSRGRASSENNSADGCCYSVKFIEKSESAGSSLSGKDRT